LIVKRLGPRGGVTNLRSEVRPEAFRLEVPFLAELFFTETLPLLALVLRAVLLAFLEDEDFGRFVAVLLLILSGLQKVL
jgi:hypothetical protein